MLNTTPLNEAQRESVAAALNSIRSSLGFLVGLRPSDKQRLLKMGNKNRAFVEDAIKAGVSNPSMLPRSIEPETLQDKLTLFGQLREVQSDLQQVTELINNTVTVMGSELYEDAAPHLLAHQDQSPSRRLEHHLRVALQALRRARPPLRRQNGRQGTVDAVARDPHGS